MVNSGLGPDVVRGQPVVYAALHSFIYECKIYLYLIAVILYCFWFHKLKKGHVGYEVPTGHEISCFLVWQLLLSIKGKGIALQFNTIIFTYIYHGATCYGDAQSITH
jgi:hypothetical protein